MYIYSVLIFNGDITDINNVEKNNTAFINKVF
jgi:hypothetical protein